MTLLLSSAALLIALLAAGIEPMSELRYCALHERGDWAVQSMIRQLYLTERPYNVRPEEVRCRVHPESRVEVVSVPAEHEEVTPSAHYER